MFRATPSLKACAGNVRAELNRAVRFDAVFFFDLPDRIQKDAIWDMYRTLFDIDAEEAIPNDDDWTGAEIRSCCRLASVLIVSLSQASQNVVRHAVEQLDPFYGQLLTKARELLIRAIIRCLSRMSLSSLGLSSY